MVFKELLHGGNIIYFKAYYFYCKFPYLSKDMKKKNPERIDISMFPSTFYVHSHLKKAD